MSNEQNESDAKAHPVDTLVMLDCPFCGSTNTDELMVRGYEAGDLTQPIIAAGCYDCGATGGSVRVPDHSTGYKEAVAAWNTRAT
jgi:Lar family restriction alleviation protein